MAHRDDPIGTAAGLLPRRMGAPGPQPQRVLRPPRGRTPSQRSRPPNPRAGNGRGPVAQRQSRDLVPRAATARRRTRIPLGGDHSDRSSTARGTHCPHHRTSRRTAALPLRPTGRGTCRAERTRRGDRSRATRAIRHVTDAGAPKQRRLTPLRCDRCPPHEGVRERRERPGRQRGHRVKAIACASGSTSVSRSSGNPRIGAIHFQAWGCARR